MTPLDEFLDETLGTYAGYVEMAYRAKDPALGAKILGDGLQQAKAALKQRIEAEKVEAVRADSSKRSGGLQSIAAMSLPVVVTFEGKQYQAFQEGYKPEATFYRNEIATNGRGDVKSLEYSLECKYVPEVKHRGRKLNDPAYMSVHMWARVTDLVATDSDDTSGLSNPPESLTHKKEEE
jgi:hypothetical protein